MDRIVTAFFNGIAKVTAKMEVVFVAVLKGIRIVSTKAVVIIENLVSKVINGLISFYNWTVKQLINLTRFLFRTYLAVEAGLIVVLQNTVSIAIKLRWGFVIIAVLILIYKYFGLYILIAAIAICAILVVIGYSEAESEEAKWDTLIDSIVKKMALPTKYFIRISIFIISTCTSLYTLHLIFPVTDNPSNIVASHKPTTAIKNPTKIDSNKSLLQNKDLNISKKNDDKHQNDKSIRDDQSIRRFTFKNIIISLFLVCSMIFLFISMEKNRYYKDNDDYILFFVSFMAFLFFLFLFLKYTLLVWPD